MQLVKGKRNGFFLEAGALDGYFQSNTFFLERDLGWTGLLVEANPVLYQALTTRHRKAWSSDLCLGTRPHPFKTGFFAYTGADPMQGLISASRSGLLKDHITAYGDEAMKSGSVVKVQCVPPASLLRALHNARNNHTHPRNPSMDTLSNPANSQNLNDARNISTNARKPSTDANIMPQIDLFSLDIENSEIEVLQAFPFDLVHVEILVVEHWDGAGGLNPDQFIGLVEGRGFFFYRRDNHDYFFLHRTPRWVEARPGDAGAVNNTQPYKPMTN